MEKEVYDFSIEKMYFYAIVNAVKFCCQQQMR